MLRSKSQHFNINSEVSSGRNVTWIAMNILLKKNTSNAIISQNVTVYIHKVWKLSRDFWECNTALLWQECYRPHGVPEECKIRVRHFRKRKIRVRWTRSDDQAVYHFRSSDEKRSPSFSFNTAMRHDAIQRSREMLHRLSALSAWGYRGHRTLYLKWKYF